MTVTDPRHPLYGQTFSLISIDVRQDRGMCCLIEREWGQNSYLPLEVTNKGSGTIPISTIPLSVRAIQQLASTYAQLVESQQHENDNSNRGPGKTTGTNRTETGMDPTQSATAATRPQATGTGMSGTGRASLKKRGVQ